MGIGIRIATGLAIASVLSSGCGTSPSSAAGGSDSERGAVTEIVVRYEVGAPPATVRGKPWGSQCVSTAYRAGLKIGREIGGRMRVVHIDPPVIPTIARVMALQMSQCPYVQWAEADVLELTLS